MRAYSAIGGRAPAHCVATGKALLAFQPPDAVDLSRERKPFTPATITSPEALRAELERIRPQDRFRPKAVKLWPPLVVAAARDLSRA